jgi:hypothetical protein
MCMMYIPSVQEQYCGSWIALRLCKLVVVPDTVTDIYEVMLNPGINH